jgi:hypothetical protein
VTGPEHYRTAEAFLSAALDKDKTPLHAAVHLVEVAQVHASLALAAASAETAHHHTIVFERCEEWAEVLK